MCIYFSYSILIWNICVSEFMPYLIMLLLYFIYKYRNGLLPMQYVFLIRSSAGCKKYVTGRSRVTYFLQPVRERIKKTYGIGKRPFIFLLLIYMRFLTIFYAKTMGFSFIADVVRNYDSEPVCHGACS